MINKKEDLFYTRYLQNKLYFKNNGYIKALFLLEKYLFENFSFNEELPISNLKFKWIYDCIKNNEFSNEISKEFLILARNKNKTKVLSLIDSFTKIPNLKNVKDFFHSLKNFNKIFNGLLNLKGNKRLKTSVIFQFVLLIYIHKYKFDNLTKTQIESNYSISDYFELVLVNIFFKSYNYKISKIYYLFNLLKGFLFKWKK